MEKSFSNQASQLVTPNEGCSLDNFKKFNSESYKILCRLDEATDGLVFHAKNQTLSLDSKQQSTLIHNFEQLIPNIAEDLEITPEAAFEKSADFFSNTQVLVQPKGIQGFVYRSMQSVQNSVPLIYTSEAVSILKTIGLTGVEIIRSAPLTFVAATYIGALFFGYCGSVAGNNPVGLVLNSTSFVLSRPMRGVEIVLNGLILGPISNVTGLPVILNGTQQMLAGKGLSIQKYTKVGIAFERIINSKIVKKGKKIYDIIFTKGE